MVIYKALRVGGITATCLFFHSPLFGVCHWQHCTSGGTLISHITLLLLLHVDRYKLSNALLAAYKIEQCIEYQHLPPRLDPDLSIEMSQMNLVCATAFPRVFPLKPIFEGFVAY